MFPCWSETFILNEIVTHIDDGMNVSIFSLKPFTEALVHPKAEALRDGVTYPLSFFNPKLYVLHLALLLKHSRQYLTILWKLLTLRTSSFRFKAMALAVFALSPGFVFSARNKTIEHLHAHFATFPALLAWILCRFLNIRFSYTAHAHDIFANSALLPLISPDACTIVTISEFNRDFILNILGREYAPKIVVLHCGVDLQELPYDRDRKSGPDGETLKILSVGRLSGIKGFNYLIDALHLLDRDGVNYSCEIIGDGRCRNALKKQILDLGLNEKITLLGAMNNKRVLQHLREADLFVLACARDTFEVHDGIPVVFMEAMAVGTPVLGTKISGIPELIKHKITGLCAESANPVSLRDNIVYFMKNPQVVESMRLRARLHIEKEFDIRQLATQLQGYFG
jgi:colanic acid/amylovoran biosynthesis glycosyltransferase